MMTVAELLAVAIVCKMCWRLGTRRATRRMLVDVRTAFERGRVQGRSEERFEWISRGGTAE